MAFENIFQRYRIQNVHRPLLDLFDGGGISVKGARLNFRDPISILENIIQRVRIQDFICPLL